MLLFLLCVGVVLLLHLDLVGSVCVPRGSERPSTAAHDAEQQGGGALHSALRVLPGPQPLLLLCSLDTAGAVGRSCGGLLT